MLRSQSYFENFIKGLENLRDRHIGCDLTLTSKDGAQYFVHRVVMAAASSYFMLRIDKEIASGQFYTLKNIDSTCLETLVNFAYSGKLDCSAFENSSIWPLLSACTELQMTDALNLCHEYLAGNTGLSSARNSNSKKSKPASLLTNSGVLTGLPIKMEMDEVHTIKQEAEIGEEDYDDDDDTYVGLDPSYQTSGELDESMGMPIVKLTPLEYDESLKDQILDFRLPKRGRPRKTWSEGYDRIKINLAARGRPRKSPVSVVRDRGRGRGRGRGRPKKHPVTDLDRSDIIEEEVSHRPVPTQLVSTQPVSTVLGNKCNICGRTFALGSLLEVHRRIKHYQRNYFHTFHRKRASLETDVTVGLDNSSGNTIYECKSCGITFRKRLDCRLHNKGHRLRHHKCNQCEAKFSYRLDLLFHQHRKHAHKLVIKNRRCTKPGNRSTANLTSAANHQGKWVSILKLPQTSSGRSVGSSLTIKDLMKTATVSRKDRTFECPICGKHFDQRERLRCHIQRHWVERFQCNQCNKSYRANTSLQAHIKAIHEGEKLMCSYESCGRTFIAKKSLENHLKFHNSDFSFTCEICNKGFVNKHHFDTHMNRHYGIKPFECALCGRKYFHSSDLSRHVKVCCDEKAIPCSFCTKQFKCEKYLKEHLRGTHHKGEPYLCNKCGREFYHRSSLHRHVEKHDKDQC